MLEISQLSAESVPQLGNSSPILENSGLTRENRTKIWFKWDLSRHLLQPICAKGQNGEYKWRMMRQRSECWSKVNLALSLESCDKPNVTATCDIHIINDPRGSRSFSVKSTTFERGKWVIVGFCPPGQCTRMILCDITIDNGIIDIEEESLTPNSKKLEGIKYQYSADLSNNLNDLLESQKLSDVTLITAAREIRAHKVILAARSPVFLAMFSHEMKEQRENRVNITDLDDEVVMEMLRFIYTGTTTNLDKMADGLLAAANKYELLALKDLCTITLCRSIATENVIDRLILGDLYDVVDLKKKALNFICIHGKEVIKTPQYESLSTTHPHLMNEAFQAIVMKTG